MTIALNFFRGGSGSLFRYCVNGGFQEVAKWCRRDAFFLNSMGMVEKLIHKMVDKLCLELQESDTVHMGKDCVFSSEPVSIGYDAVKSRN